MTVKQLIARLQEHDPEMEVVIAQPTYDHQGHIATIEPDDCFQECFIKYSDYHSTGIVADTIHGNPSECKEVLVLDGRKMKEWAV